MRSVRDDLAQTYGMGVFFLSLVVGSVILVLIQPAYVPMVNQAENRTPEITSNATRETAALTGLEWSRFALDNMVVIFTLIAVVGLIVVAIYTRRGRF